MKKGFIAIAIMMAFGAAVLIASGAVAHTTKSGDVADTLMIQDPLFKKHKKAAVKFTHKQHAVDLKIDCADCHHVFEGGKNVWKEGDKVDKCSACHTSPTKNDGKTLSLKNAFHKNCQGCHKKEKKGPTKCNECHPKKKK